MQLISFAKKWLPVAYTLFLLVLTTYPSMDLPKGNINDKTAHFIAFAALSFLWILRVPDFLKVSVFSMLYGVFIEVVQSLLPVHFNRHFEFLDIVSDTAGVIIGLVLYKVFVAIF